VSVDVTGELQRSSAHRAFRDGNTGALLGEREALDAARRVLAAAS